MSQQKKPRLSITNRILMLRLLRLPIVKHLQVSEIIAYLGLILVNKGQPIALGKALRIIKKSKLDLKIEANSYIPCENILDALIHLVIYKRELFNKFLEHEDDFPVWEDEVAAPLLDIIKTISEIYKI